MQLKEIEKSIIERTITEITSHAAKIRAFCFKGCTALTTADLPNVTSIENAAFRNCTALTTADFPNVTSIGEMPFANCSSCDVHLYPGILTIDRQGGDIGFDMNNPPKAIYLHYTNNDEVLFSPANMIGEGGSKGTLTYNIYTDNTIIKDGVLSKADQYTIVNVKHLDGSDW